MKIGKIINYHRKKQQMTQEQLCDGICSISHLSKIENNSKEVNIETLNLLCMKLGISVEDEKNKVNHIKIKLHEFYDSIERLHHKKADALYLDLRKYREFVLYTELLYVYELYMLRYILFLNQLELAEQMIEKMSQNVRMFSEFELFVWNVLNAIFNHKRNNFIKSLNFLDEVKDLRKQYRDEITEYYYLKSLMHCRLGQSALAIYFGNKALEVFKQRNNIIRTLDVKTILSIHLTETGEYERAENLLKEILDDAELIQNTTIVEMAWHNLGYLYGAKNLSEKALECYYKSLALIEKNTESYYLTLGNIASHLLKLQKNEQVVNMLEHELELFEEKTKLEYVKLRVLYFEAKNEEKALIQYLMEDGLPIMEKHGNRMKVYEYSERIAEYYQDQGDPLLANKYLQISLHQMKKTHNKGVIR
ncbi:helix-turn-helix domain-containing protein [Gottfriedia sp. S16(2024)]|uniref:helix-turn-helix domain-containing protein n=1 Tax=Bacillaceae TaxID=186817 RepID=UPI0007009190|nr:helix-turn-helix domain-containing protein [Bacillus sp. FJAT-25509]